MKQKIKKLLDLLFRRDLEKRIYALEENQKKLMESKAVEDPQVSTSDKPKINYM